jgi:hypothetical protein
MLRSLMSSVSALRAFLATVPTRVEFIVRLEGEPCACTGRVTA